MKAKTKLTRLWSVLLALVMVVGMIPIAALATGSVAATADFSADPTAALALLNAAKTGTTDSTWDSSNNTLTLNGVNFTTTASTAVKLPDGSTIVLNGVNTIKGVGSSSEDSSGIYADGALTIQGTGTLNVTCGNAKEYSHGIYADDCMTITGGNVTVTGGTSNYYNSCGIYVEYDIKISGGTVKAIGGAAYNYSLGIYADNVYISGTADVTAEGGSAANDDSNGICAYYDVTITGGNVKAIGGTANSLSVGISADNGAVIISGGTVTANGGKATDDSCGICTKGNITITDGTVTANGGEARDSYGIYASGHDKDNISVKISGTADVTATGGEAGDSYGIYADDDVNIAGGTVNANGGTATNNSYGIYAHYDVNISGGTVIAKANTSALDYTPQALPSTYWWRTSNSGAYNKYPASAYIWDAAHTYLEIQKPGYTVTFDANGGSGEMAGADVVSGEYTLPANGFTAPEGKRFKAWSVNGTEKAVGDKITVSANTTVRAVWENITYTVSFDSNGGTGTMTAQTGVLSDYTLPANGFTAPVGKQFKAWSVNGNEKAVGDKITVSANTTVKAVWEKIPAAPIEYEILDGANNSWTQDSDGNISVRGSGAFSKFVGVKVDGKSVDEKYYTVKEGSTIVTLKPEYLNTLTAGKHTLEIVWTDGSASTAFTVSAQTVAESPQTGDNSMMWIWIAVLFVSGIGVMGTTIYIRKKKYSVK